MTLKVDQNSKPISIAEFSFDDDSFMWYQSAPTLSIGKGSVHAAGRLLLRWRAKASSIRSKD